jgi:hypothetical protein
MTDGAAFSSHPGRFLGFGDNAVSRGESSEAASITVVLHDLSHTTSADQGLRSFYGPLTKDAERGTSRNGSSIGAAIGEPFECLTFEIGC